MTHAVATAPSKLDSTIPRMCDGLHESISSIAIRQVASTSIRLSVPGLLGGKPSNTCLKAASGFRSI